MVVTLRPEVKPGTSLRSLVNGFVLTKQTEGKSPRTVEFYSENLKRFLWYASKQDWSDDIRMLTEWHIREFLGYVANEKCRWGLVGNGSETSQIKASHTTVHHYFVVLANFFGWVIREGFTSESPTAKIKVAKPKEKIIKPYTHEEINRMLASIKASSWVRPSALLNKSTACFTAAFAASSTLSPEAITMV